MKEDELLQVAATAVARLGRDDSITAAGIFQPRGHSGSAFAGGLAGDSAGGAFGRIGSDIGEVAGVRGAQHAHDAASGLPEYMLVAVGESAVYGFQSARGHHDEAGPLVFEVSREGLETKVHGRVNVKVVELIHADSGSKVELEGSRIGATHASDVIEALAG